MSSPRATQAPAGGQRPLLEVEGLVKRYPRRGEAEPLLAVNDVSFAVGRGEIVGLLGPNGAGKTTTIKMICGLVLPDAGSVRLAGLDLRRHRAACLRRIAAVLEGNRNLYWRLTALENLLYFAGNRGVGGASTRREAEELLERFGLAEKRDQLVSQLSRGMQQKLAIAVAMLAGSEVVLLDEPTLGLDVEAGYEIRALLKEVAASGRTIIISTHDMPVVQDLCHRTVIIGSGRVVADERVDDLLRLFETRAYSVRLGAPLSAAQLEELEASFQLLEVAEDGLSLHVNFGSGDDIYVLMAALERERTPVESLDRTTVDFEQVFRRLVNGGGTAGARSPHRVAAAALEVERAG